MLEKEFEMVPACVQKEFFAIIALALKFGLFIRARSIIYPDGSVV